MNRTPLYEYHSAHGRMVEFAGYEMPIWYTSIADEHLAVRNHAGMFDVSHMGRVIIRGAEAGRFVDRIVPTSGSPQPVGKSFYTLFLNESAGIIDDLIVIKRGEEDYLLVVNAANKQKDMNHIKHTASDFDIEIEDVTDSSTMMAIQGPDAIQALQPLADTDLASMKRFTHVLGRLGESRATITRTGYTGEDGFEAILYDAGVRDNSAAVNVWRQLAERAKPCALGARDSLRIEAGLPLYGSDIDEGTNPIEADLAWVITKGKTGYIGSESIKSLTASVPTRLRRGIILSDKIPRAGFEVVDGEGRRIGRVTSGTFSPILKRGVAIAYMNTPYSNIGQKLSVVIRGSPAEGAVVKPPFYDEGLYGWKRGRVAKSI